MIVQQRVHRDVEAYVTSDPQAQVHLTPNGRETTEEAVDALLPNNIDLIFVSPVLRTLETAEIVREKLGLPQEAVVVDVRLREVGFGERTGFVTSSANERVDRKQDLRTRIGGAVFPTTRSRTPGRRKNRGVCRIGRPRRRCRIHREADRSDRKRLPSRPGP